MRKDAPNRKDLAQTIEKIVQSGVLGASERRVVLLRYLLDKELDGRGDEIKAFSIAVDVLGRDASFDPATDSIVRSEVGRLRDALRLFNAEHADQDDVIIEIPKGTYRPKFKQAKTVGDRSKPQATAAIVLTVLIVVFAISIGIYMATPDKNLSGDAGPQVTSSDLPFEPIKVAVPLPDVLSSRENPDRIAVGLNTELMTDLSAYPWLSVVAPVRGIEGIDPVDVDYVLDGVFYWDADELEARARLVTYPDQILVWSDTQIVDHEASAIREVIQNLSSNIAYRLASGEGIAPELTRVKNTSSSDESMDAYLCYLGLHRYAVSPTDADHLQLRTCLLDAVANFPEFGDGWAALALVYVDEARFQTNPRENADPWADAAKAVEKALRYAPLRMASLNVALVNSVEAPSPDVKEFDRISSLLLNLFPKHPPTLYNVGSRAAEFLGRWDEGMGLIDQAIELHPNPPGLYHLTHAYHAAMSGTASDALRATSGLNNENSISQLLLKYLATARNDLREDQQTYQDLLAQRGFSTQEDLIALVKRRGYVADLEAALLTQLESIAKHRSQQ